MRTDNPLPLTAPPVPSTTKGTDIMNQMLLQQYQNSPLLKQYISAYVEEMDLLFEETEKVYLGRFLQYAEGTQLDIIGYILGEERNISLPTLFFGFQDGTNSTRPPNVEDPSFADENAPAVGGVFRSEGQSGSENYALSDNEFRRLLSAKAIISTSDVCSINQAYYAITILLGRVPLVMRFLPLTTARNVELELDVNDTTAADEALILYFSKYIIPLGTTIQISRI